MFCVHIAGRSGIVKAGSTPAGGASRASRAGCVIGPALAPRNVSADVAAHERPGIERACRSGTPDVQLESDTDSARCTDAPVDNVSWLPPGLPAYSPATCSRGA